MPVSSPLQLEQCTLTKMVIQTRLNGHLGTETEDAADIKLTYNVRPHKTSLKFLVPFNLSISWPEDVPSAYDQIDIALNGIFSFPADTEDEVIQHYVPMLCLTNLYGIARGIIAQTTGMCQDGPYLLSLINMEQLLQGMPAEEDEVEEEPVDEGDGFLDESEVTTKTVSAKKR